jgi:hypothetical protein
LRRVISKKAKEETLRGNAVALIIIYFINYANFEKYVLETESREAGKQDFLMNFLVKI